MTKRDAAKALLLAVEWLVAVLRREDASTLVEKRVKLLDVLEHLDQVMP